MVDFDGLASGEQAVVIAGDSGVGKSSLVRAGVLPAIEKANEIDDRPVVVDFRVDAREKVFPMIPAGVSNDDLILPQSQNDRRSALR